MSNSRDALTSRQLPEMVMSTTSNSLTAPILQKPGLTAQERAAERFAIAGNAIVTGGAGKLGLTAARGLLEHGLSGLCLFDLQSTFDSEPSKSQIETLGQEFPNARIIKHDVNVTDETSVEGAVKAAADELGGIDILLCFAGVVGCVHAADMSASEWKRVIDINMTGSWFCAQAVGKKMIERGRGGSIVFTASISAHRVSFPQPQVAYNVSKGALLQLKSSLAAEWARYGIRVNSISPGYMDTILNEGAGLERARALWAERNPTGRMGQPEELIGSVVLLCSNAGKYINGADILVDGGITVF